MPNKSVEELRSELLEVMKKGDEEAAKNFIIDHLKEFPQDTQSEIMLALFQEAVDDQLASVEAVEDFQKQALETLRQLGEVKEEAEKKKKLLEIKDSA